jgi:DNA-binding LacI/PurR family transcriptional regulator
MSTKPKITITHVAKAAGVALGTVSRVLNNHPDVNAEIRARVQETARRLNYTRIRQRKARDHSNGGPTIGNIAMIFFGMEDTLAQLPVVGAALQGIEGALAGRGRNLMIASIPKGDRVPPFLLEKRIEGLILKGPNQGALPTLAESELLGHIYRWPRVWLMGRLGNAQGDHCNFDTDVAGRLAVENFFAKGHRRIAFFNPKPGQSQFEKLKNGFFNAAARIGCNAVLLETAPAEKLEWPLPATTLQPNVNELLDRWAALPAKTRPTALFVPSDRTAVQLYSALERRGLRAGADVSVISCNNEQSLLADLHPALTTIDVHAEAIGRRAVDQLLWRITHPSDSLPVQVLVEPTLVERDSVTAL